MLFKLKSSPYSEFIKELIFVFDLVTKGIAQQKLHAIFLYLRYDADLNVALKVLMLMSGKQGHEIQNTTVVLQMEVYTQRFSI